MIVGVLDSLYMIPEASVSRVYSPRFKTTGHVTVFVLSDLTTFPLISISMKLHSLLSTAGGEYLTALNVSMAPDVAPALTRSQPFHPYIGFFSIVNKVAHVLPPSFETSNLPPTYLSALRVLGKKYLMLSMVPT